MQRRVMPINILCKARCRKTWNSPCFIIQYFVNSYNEWPKIWSISSGSSHMLCSYCLMNKNTLNGIFYRFPMIPIRKVILWIVALKSPYHDRPPLHHTIFFIENFTRDYWWRTKITRILTLKNHVVNRHEQEAALITIQHEWLLNPTRRGTVI